MDDTERDRILRRIDNGVQALLRLAGGEAASLAVLLAGAANQEDMMATLQELTNDLTARVEPLQDAVQAGTTLLDELGATILDLLRQIQENGLTPELEAQLAAIGQTMTTESSALMDAVVRNTPAEPVNPGA